METREYIVGLQKNINYDQFWEEMENSTSGLLNIPDRIVDIKDERVGSKRLCHYLLTDEEAKKLRNDSRVLTVEIPPSQRKDIKLVSDAIDEGNFIKDLAQFISNRNWGLKRVRSKNNNYGLDINGGNTYEYILDGEGIDVVITDSGIDVQHPEFRNLETDTKKRVQEIDWYVEAGLAENVLNNLATSTTCCISTKSHINFLVSTVVSGIFLKNPFKEIVPKELMGPGLVLGPMLGFGQPSFIKSYAIYTNSENNNKSFRIRYEGLISTDSSNNATLSNLNLVWEVTFFDDNKLQINVIKYLGSLLKNNWPYYWNNMNWYIHEDTKTTEFPLFYDTINSPRSIVLTTEDNGHTWNRYGNNNISYHVVTDGENGWIIEEGAALELGASGMTPLFTPGDTTPNVSNEAVYNFNTPFDFFVGNITTSPQSYFHYRDREGHGTHVAAIAAGKRSGWARSSRIYSMKLAGLEGPGDSGTGIPIETGLDLIKLWHMNKPIDPKTGYKRPTIVNMSWGYNRSYSNVTGGEYRGTPWVGNEPIGEYGMISFIFNNYHGVRITSVDIDIEEMIDEGIHVCISAGNTFHKIDSPGGIDYNNYWVYDDGVNPSEIVYYHQGSSPYSDRAFIVGAMDSISYDIDTDQKASYSCSGPGVDLYAPGSEITSACSRYSNIGSSWPYWWDLLDYTTFWQQISINGTSMACPQVCGVGALILQLYPNASPEQLKTYILHNAGSAFRSTGLDNDYLDWNTTHGGDPKTLYLPFGVNQSFNSNVNISGISITKK